MIFLKNIQIDGFKGIKHLSCNLEDLTLLTGLNNSGKTTLLQAVHLLIDSLSYIPFDENLFGKNKRIDLKSSLASLGLQDINALLPRMQRNADSKIVATFSDDISVKLEPYSGTTFLYRFSSIGDEDFSAEEWKSILVDMAEIGTEFVTPPGTISSREDMLPKPNYENILSQGKGAQLWRNSIWWSIQDGGYESFEAVKSLVKRYFPEVEISQPTLGSSNPPEILINYDDKNEARLDISQSGAGLRTFLTLARLLEQSPAKILLLDEPDAHLHASQQAVVINLLLDIAAEQHKQVIIASHSPEFIIRTPSECIRWIEQTKTSEQPDELDFYLERLGVTPDIYTGARMSPDVIVYVEGRTDKPILESLIRWCRQKYENVPKALIVPHRDGRFDAEALQAIAQVEKRVGRNTRIIGIRDLDWYYSDLPDSKPQIREGNGWKLLTLPCKEIENLFCCPDFLFLALGGKISKKIIDQIIDEESQSEALVREWENQVKHRIRNTLPNFNDASTKEGLANETFAQWSIDSSIRRRLVAGKDLLRSIRTRLKVEYQVNKYPQQMFDDIEELTPDWFFIANSIFPEVESFGASR
jgi:energy-coupling factor transporter ATP-binding protein EcfA2